MTGKSENHNLAVKEIQTQVSDFFTRRKRARVFHGGTNSTRSRNIDRSQLIDIRRLSNIVEINPDKRYVLVEPNVTLEQLVDATLEYGLIPPVISEFPAITVGGAIQGGVGESSSFKWGCFHEPCLEYEVVQGNGDRILASPDKNADLFRGISCSYGSLGIITMVKLRLIPAPPKIKLAYHKIGSYEEAVKLIGKHTKPSRDGPDFIDSIMFSKTSGLIMIGSFTTQTDLPEASFHKFSDEWFYLYAQQIANSPDVHEELVPVKDYLFRYDRGAFWMGREGFSVLHLPFTRFTRLLLAPLLKTRTMYRFLHGARLGQQFLVQDICLPKDNVVPFMKFIDKNYEIYPLWLCPLKPSKKEILSPTQLDTGLVINVGVWGAMSEDYEKFVRNNRQLEKEVYKFGGRKVLYAHTYYSKAEFWRIYNRVQYNKLRKKYSAEVVFPDIYEKTNVSVRYEPSIARGWWKLLTGS